MKVALAWAPPTNPPGSAMQAIRGHVKGLQEAGHEVDVYYGPHLEKLLLRQKEYHFVIWPSNLYGKKEFRELDVHKHFHFIGVDQPNNEEAFKEAVRISDSMSAVDPNCTVFFGSYMGMTLDDCRLIPNSPNTDLFTAEEPPSEDSFILSPKIGANQKEGSGLRRVSERTPNQQYETHAGDTSTVPRMPFNVTIKPAVPWTLMPGRYRDCSMVVNPSQNEGLPNVAYEAFASQRLYLSTKAAIGDVQMLPLDSMEEWVSNLGKPVFQFEKQHIDIYREGDHYVATDGYDELVRKVEDSYVNEEKRWNKAIKASKWANTLSELWKWEDVSQAIVEAVEEER